MSRINFSIALGIIVLLVADPAVAAVSGWQQKGATISPRSTTEIGSDAYTRSLDNLKSTGANFVTLIIPYYQPSLSATTMGPGADTPTDSSLISGIAYAHSIGLKVNLKPHLQIADSNAWRATIKPANRAAWFSSYEKMLQHYAGIAQSTGVEQITIGTELINMASNAVNSQNAAFWSGIIDRLRPIYFGQLTYSANWGADGWYDEKNSIRFWDKLDLIGISAYFYMTPTRSYTMQQLYDRWEYWNNIEVKPLQAKWGKPVVFTEAGYRSVDGNLMRPPLWEGTGTYDGQEQADGYEAMFSYWDGQPFMQGVQIWEWIPDPNAGGPGDRSFTPQNKPAQSVLATWFGGNPSDIQAFSASITSLTPNPVANSPINFEFAVKNMGGPSTVALDVEIFNSTGVKIYQFVAENQGFQPQESKMLPVAWTPAASGSYTVKFGVFTNDWSKLLLWNNQAASVTVGPAPLVSCNSINLDSQSFHSKASESIWNITVAASDPACTWTATSDSSWLVIKNTSPSPPKGNGTVEVMAQTNPGPARTGKLMIGGIEYEVFQEGAASPAPPPAPAPTPVPAPTPTPVPTAESIDVWWPTNGSVISGNQPFQAIINSLDINTYDIYWQVDGDVLNPMYSDSSFNGLMHKHAWVDVSGWWWRGSGPYKVTFIAKDKTGKILATKDIFVTVAH